MKVLVIGGAGYIGCVLVPALLSAGHQVTVFDALFFGRKVLAGFESHANFRLVVGDIRDEVAVRGVLRSRPDAVIFLAAVSNHPCCERDAVLTTAINRDATEAVMRLCAATGVRRFLFASSSSVYGVSELPRVTESLPLRPITLYADYKVWGEQVLTELASASFCPVMIRAGTVAGLSPRLRLDLTAHILTMSALTTGEISVWGGDQRRPHIDIRELVAFYLTLLSAPLKMIHGLAFNVVAENHSVMAMAEKIAELVGEVKIKRTAAVDARSYRLDGTLAAQRLGFTPRISLTEAVGELIAAYRAGEVPDPAHPRYHNIELMREQSRRWHQQEPA
jgi:nucleoside-diphosphate-sugar epimerase